MMPIQLQAIIEGVSTRKDGTMSVRVGTQELDLSEKVALMEYVQVFGWFMFAPNQFDEAQIPKAPASDERKSHSQRLRGAIYVLWEQRGSEGDFEVFYRKLMEKAINRVKDLLT